MRGVNQVELLFVLDSSADGKGKRVIIREGVVENLLWPGDESQLTDSELKLIGLTHQDQLCIGEFFASVSDWYYSEERDDTTCQLSLLHA